MNSGFGPLRSPCFLPSNRPIILSPTTYCRPGHILGFDASGLPDHIAFAATLLGSCVLGFASALQARHDSRPNRVHLRYGLIVHLRLLPTPPRGNAVTFSYEVPEHFGKDLHPAGSMPLQAHSAAACRRFS
jgi:hypothetical protein